MKQLKIFAALFVAAIAFSSCAHYSYTSRSTAINRKDMNATSMIVDVRPDFNKRIMAESSRCKSLTEARDEARYRAISENKCDVIVDPVYKIEQRGFKFKAYLTGFAGYYENARTLLQDIQLYKDVKKEDIEKYLILKDPSILGLINKAGNSEVINIYEGKPEPKECHKNAPAPAQEEASAKKKK